MGYVYAIQFDDLAIKVGRSDDAIGRISQHQVAAARHGHSLLRAWSAWTVDPVGTEGRLIDHCLSHGTARRGTREYFTGVPWDSSAWDTIASHGTEDVPSQLSQSVPGQAVPDSWGVRKVIYEGVLSGTRDTAGLIHLAKAKGFTSESWFFVGLKRLQTDGLIRRGVRNGTYEPTGTESDEK